MKYSASLYKIIEPRKTNSFGSLKSIELFVREIKLVSQILRYMSRSRSSEMSFESWHLKLVDVQKVSRILILTIRHKLLRREDE